MSFIELKKVCKQYPGTDKKAVTDFDLEINEKEFMHLLDHPAVENLRHCG